MDVLQLLVRVIAVDDVCFMDHFLCLSDFFLMCDVSSFITISFKICVYVFAETRPLFLPKWEQRTERKTF